jgi:hypothetical protein
LGAISDQGREPQEPVGVNFDGFEHHFVSALPIGLDGNPTQHPGHWCASLRQDRARATNNLLIR